MKSEACGKVLQGGFRLRRDSQSQCQELIADQGLRVARCALDALNEAPSKEVTDFFESILNMIEKDAVTQNNQPWQQRKESTVTHTPNSKASC